MKKQALKWILLAGCVALAGAAAFALWRVSLWPAPAHAAPQETELLYGAEGSDPSLDFHNGRAFVGEGYAEYDASETGGYPGSKVKFPKYRVIDRGGKTVRETDYVEIGGYSEGLTAVSRYAADPAARRSLSIFPMQNPFRKGAPPFLPHPAAGATSTRPANTSGSRNKAEQPLPSCRWGTARHLTYFILTSFPRCTMIMEESA